MKVYASLIITTKEFLLPYQNGKILNIELLFLLAKLLETKHSMTLLMSSDSPIPVQKLFEGVLRAWTF